MIPKKLFKKVLLLTLVTVLLFTGVSVKLAQAAEVPKYVFFFIGDGMGASQRQAAEYYLKNITGDKTKKLTMNKLPVAGLNTTQAADSLVTDSAAAGTALATGHKTNSQVIAQSPDGTHLKTLVEAAEEQGMATGIITTSRLTHATPATFASHVKNRYLPNKIANQYLKSGVDFFAGGGYRHFIPSNGLEYKGQKLKSKRKDDRNLVKKFENKGYTTFLSKQDTESFFSFNPQGKEKVFASFTYSHTPYELDRKRTDATPSLAKMTEKGIDTLANYNNGFFMMVEGARIDHACHANDPAGAVHDTLAFDKAVNKAYDFYKQHPDETLIIVAADHETGGFGLGFAKQYFLKMDQLQKAKVTTASTLAGKYKEFNQDKAKYFNYIAEKLGLEDLNPEEKETIIKAMNIVEEDRKYDTSTYGPSYYDPVAIATTHVLSKRAGLEWTTYAHSATPVPLTAIGVEAEKLGGYKDNTEVGRTIAHIMNFQLTTTY
ncbi:alkaline phosphatase [Sporohalobacter salinus]|uniref:alkaline phosphatase n=1 Tax=Sporohalobacter salinus TaxID=1494606 RepID=UPI00195FF782|nr:alkaline phosphatase [Sporohalobacter salinus]MBM7622476.1 alkaline phosphatase [Sporohalobacter salinus]